MDNTEKAKSVSVEGVIEYGVKAGCHYCDAWLENGYSFRVSTDTAAAVCLRDECLAKVLAE